MFRRARYWVVCDDHAAGPYKSRKLAQHAGSAIVYWQGCLGSHVIVQAVERPVTKAELRKQETSD